MRRLRVRCGRAEVWGPGVLALLLGTLGSPEAGAAQGIGAADGRVAKAMVARVLDDWHQAASVADGARYFGHFAPEGVFLGTDDGERWTVEEFRRYAEAHFSRGKGWTYRASQRHVEFSPEGTVAWIDEKLDNDAYGRLRGTGVLRRVDGRWRIAQYSMSFPIPNEVTREVVDLVRGRQARTP